MTEAKGKAENGNGQARTSEFPLSTSPLSPSPLGIGLVGLGHWGSSYARTLLALPECRLIAAADTNDAARTRAGQEFGIAARSTVEELLSDTAIEALVIATPDRTHFSLAAAALKAGRDVLVEKPMALEPQETEALTGQAEAGGRVLAVGHTAVYHPDFESLRARLDGLPLDSARQLSAVRTSSGPSAARQSASLCPQSAICNPQSAIIFDLCPHDLAMAVLLLGAPVAARARCGRTDVEYEVRFQNDALLSGRAEWREPPHTRRFEVASQWGKAKVEMTNDRTLRFPLSTSPLGRQCLDFFACCRTRRQPLSNGRLGMDVTRCLAALAASCADGNEWVPLSSELRTPDAERRTADSGLRTSDFGVRT